MQAAEHKLTPAPEKNGNSIPAQLFFLTKEVQQLVAHRKEDIKNQQLFKVALEQGLNRIADEMDRRDRIYQEEFKKGRATTRLWGSFGWGIGAFLLKHLWDKVSIYWYKIFSL